MCAGIAWSACLISGGIHDNNQLSAMRQDRPRVRMCCETRNSRGIARRTWGASRNRSGDLVEEAIQQRAAPGEEVQA